MFKLDLKNRKSIYEQIIDGYKGMIVSGELTAGAKLPSVRELSKELVVNPNTIQKAYSALEAQGWIYMVSGRGCFVSERTHQPDEKLLAAALARLDEAVRELGFLGVSAEKVAEYITKGSAGQKDERSEDGREQE